MVYQEAGLNDESTFTYEFWERMHQKDDSFRLPPMDRVSSVKVERGNIYFMREDGNPVLGFAPAFPLVPTRQTAEDWYKEATGQ